MGENESFWTFRTAYFLCFSSRTIFLGHQLLLQSEHCSAHSGWWATTFAVADAKVDNSAELWHCRMVHANMPDIKRLQHLALGVQISPRHKLQFCEPCVLSKLTNRPFQNMGEKPDRPKQVFGADVTGPHPKSPAGFQYLLEIICFFSGFVRPWGRHNHVIDRSRFFGKQRDFLAECTHKYSQL